MFYLFNIVFHCSIFFLIIKNFSINFVFISEFNFINYSLIRLFIVINRSLILFFIWRNWFATKFCWFRLCCRTCWFCKSCDKLKIKRLWFTNSKKNWSSINEIQINLKINCFMNITERLKWYFILWNDVDNLCIINYILIW